MRQHGRIARTAQVVVLGTLVLLCAAAPAEQVKLNVELAHPMLQAGRKQKTYLKVGLTGFEMTAEERTPVNVAIVLDKSGSMSGEKIARAKEGAIMAVNRLRPDDIVSVVAYSQGVEVVVPATKARDREKIVAAINRMEAGGRTALFAGVSKGAREVRKFIDPGRVNRVVLLSDGLANVGPSSPRELSEVGASLNKEGIAVTTFGLGLDYNEDLMTQLAVKSEGNHFFARTAADLRKAFDLEFSIGLAVVAQEVVVKIACADGVRPVRVLNADADITNGRVVVGLNQIYSKREAALLLEVEVSPGEVGEVRDVASVEVTYANMQTETTDRLTSDLSVRFVKSARAAREHRNREIMVAVVQKLANEQNIRAMELRDEGKVKEAQQALQQNAEYLRANAHELDSKKLEKEAEENEEDAEAVESARRYKARRKDMQDRQSEQGPPSLAF